MDAIARSDRPTELQLKQDATITNRRPYDRHERTVRIRTETVESIDRWALTDAVRKMARRGEVRPLWAQPQWNFQSGTWQIKVVRIKPTPPAWRKRAMIATAVLLPLAGLAALGWWVLVSLTVPALATFLGCALIALVLLLAHGRDRGRKITITQTVTIGGR